MSSLHAQQRRHIDDILRYADGGYRPTVSPGDAMIARSWKRCIEEYGLDPARPRPARIVTHQTLREHQESADEFLNVARAGVEQLYGQIARLGYVLLLTDQRGITVQFLGDRRHDQRLRQAGLYLGADWNEYHAGTCAVGTCIREGEALTCHRQDHFDATHIGLTCTSAPITDPQGRLLAVLDISALDSAPTRDSQNFALHLIRLYARMIEDAYFLRLYRHHTVFRCDTSRELVQVNGQYLFALDGDGRVLAANGVGRHLLARARTDDGDIALPEMFDCDARDIWSIPYACEDQVRAFRVQALGSTLFGSLIEPRRPARPAAPQALIPEEAVPELDRLAADDPAMRRTLKLAKRLRQRDVSLLILGETGTGKEVLARAIHDAGPRRHKPFVAVNCAAIPESLIESELFGYSPGTFTGARAKGMRGLIQQAHGGTLFLDEIGDMPLTLQTRLLRVLAEGEVLPLGSERPISVDCRVIAATHRDPARLIADGYFREDLYYRLNGATLRLPALRERADKQHVIISVMDQLARAVGQPRLQLRADAMSALLACPWPGNIRQLVNALNFAEATCDGEQITVNDLPEECLAQVIGPGTTPATTEDDDDGDPQRAGLLSILKRHHWMISAVARELGVSRPTVYRRMRKHGLTPPNQRDG
ncbi:sigma-54-dependent Fis family transcriptional regulator [Alloalcanivorax xenomutans]|uniref:sigma-54-dependent Fis family transcriptional regulator n=1 Tax=Alloalcanivorax xenomutans TaxID=1094342 RepID=UPI003BA96AE7